MKKNPQIRPKKTGNKAAGNYKLFLILLFLGSVTLSFILNRPKVYVVILSDSGFIPQEITIPRGSIVEWKIEGKNLHWPATNDHPTHTVYPEGGGCIGSKLDACRGLKAGASYSFKFDRSGSWGIHDHTAAQSTMVVKVKEVDNQKNERTIGSRDRKHLQLFSEKQKMQLTAYSKVITAEVAAEKAFEICTDLRGTKFREAQHCYSEVFYFVAKQNSQKFAFNTISVLVKNPKNLTKACHLMAHGVGNGIYDKNPENWQDEIGKASSECSYGEIHGILEGYSSSGNNPFDKKKIPDICIKNNDPACYHGLGHVLIVQTGNDLKKAANLCYVLSEHGAADNCQKGVFMENMIGQSLEDHGLVTAERRKFFYTHLDEFEKLCAAQTNKDFIKACWTETIHASVTKFHGSAEEVFDFCAKAQLPQAAAGCRLHSLAELVPRNGFDPFKAAYMCKIPIENEPGFEKDCYNMIVSVIMANSPNKIDSASSFCLSLGPEFEHQCVYMVKRQVNLLRAQDPDKADSLCQNGKSEAQVVCSKD